MRPRVGDTVRIDTPGNVRLDGTHATVREVTEWGCHLDAPAAATGKFRAAWHEMTPVRFSLTGQACEDCGSFQLARTGTCVTCMDCGRNEGCG